MQIGLGVMGLDPAVFWHMTFPEFRARLEGFKEFHAIKDKPGGKQVRQAMDKMLDEFPDGPLPRRVRRQHANQKARRLLH